MISWILSGRKMIQMLCKKNKYANLWVHSASSKEIMDEFCQHKNDHWGLELLDHNTFMSWRLSACLHGGRVTPLEGLTFQKGQKIAPLSMCRVIPRATCISANKVTDPETIRVHDQQIRLEVDDVEFALRLVVFDIFEKRLNVFSRPCFLYEESGRLAAFLFFFHLLRGWSSTAPSVRTYVLVKTSAY